MNLTDNRPLRHPTPSLEPSQPGPDGGGRMTAATVVPPCGTELPPDSKFCNGCGAPVTEPTRCGVQAGDGAVRRCGAFDGHRRGGGCGAAARNHGRAATVLQRWCSGTAARWTSSPATASWRCSARQWRWRTTLFVPVWRRWAFRRRAKRLAAEVKDRDGIDLRLRVGLNSGQVIAGEIGSGSFGYTAIGEQVGMAQRMESVAPPGGVMLSASTARLVDGAASSGRI